MLVKICGRVRGKFAGNYPENREDEQLHLNNRGDQIVVQGLPERSDLIRLGQSYMVRQGTAVAPVTAEPTTAAHYSVWNGENPGGRSYVIDMIGCAITTSTAVATALYTVAQLNLTNPITAPSAGDTPKSLSGRKNYGGKGLFRQSVTITDDGGWHNVGPALFPPQGSATSGLVYEFSTLGRYIVPPQGMFSLASVATTTTGAVKYWVIYHEVDIIMA